uniref:Uncharacterized protein n=1 Tax=Variovorax paradoxus (strain S110) TaxID=543728 RepID=C5CLR5_VARPS
MNATQPMQPTAPLSMTAKFFWDHAEWFTLLDGDSAKSRTKSALRLAEAEAQYLNAESLAGYTFKVRANRKSNRPRTWTMWIAQADGQPVAWLDDVADNGPVNRRVVRAELALDAAETLKPALAAAR